MKIKATQTPEDYIEINLKELQRKPALVKFWSNFHSYLATQRNANIADIKKSFKLTCSEKGVFYRVVYSGFMNNPLNLRGSLLKGGAI